jgi:fatty-acyl-CoA synthase
MAVFDDQGFCNIVGRITDMVIRGGENIYPREVEEFLYKHPKIQEVQIFGVPDPKFGEELCAWIKLRQNESLCQEELTDYCRDRISHYKIPRYVRFVDEFPMTASGKMQKFIMRETMQRELGLVTVETA